MPIRTSIMLSLDSFCEPFHPSFTLRVLAYQPFLFAPMAWLLFLALQFRGRASSASLGDSSWRSWRPRPPLSLAVIILVVI